MAPWLEEYIAALDARDAVEKASHEIYTAYARLADRTAALPSASPSTEEAPPANDSPIRPSGIRSPSYQAPASTASLAANLSDAQAARSSLQSQLSKLQASSATVVAQLDTLRSSHATLSAQHNTLQMRFRDRDSELRGKAKLLENLQDELATTEMELTVQTREMDKLKQENQALVDRWMKKMQGEAEEMNVALEGGERRRQRPKGGHDVGTGES
ncbi:putative autophagy protein [Phaeomoniella chlamydospora]|uniref:Putative autophagy protein n=1 Tax=Phaeomoniella chlamydospora TaxID=158046 RepID=A0A0G2H5H1_PHACM|nr:putative autophagy protein [Phaeomoniella chlamydospora]